jgi:glycerol-3-phosphate dehydrogenase
MNREQSVEQIRSRKKPFDIAIIGGGATGAGIALDAASRGMAAVLLEKDDFAAGTSSRSTKLIHGGLRYLAQGHIGLVRESLTERAYVLRNAPHLAHAQSFVVPCANWAEYARYRVGLKLYDWLAGDLNLAPSRAIAAADLATLLPQLRREGVIGAIEYCDAQFDDARFVIDLLATAVRYGAVVLNYATVVALNRDRSGRLRTLVCNEREAGDEIEISARAFVNATGAYNDSIRRLDGQDEATTVVPSQGSHIVVDAAFMSGDHALLMPKTPDKRIMFAIPWTGRVLIGTTDLELRRPPETPIPTRDEIDQILEVCAAYLTHPPTDTDILSCFAGIRPLVLPAAHAVSSKVSREHRIDVSSTGLASICGGKWTTYRRMAEDCVDFVLKTTGLAFPACTTKTLKVEPAAAGQYDSTPDHALHDRLPYRTSAVRAAAREEMARTVEDVLARRTRALFLDAAAARAAAPAVADILAQELGRDNDWRDDQVAQFDSIAKNFLVN